MSTTAPKEEPTGRVNPGPGYPGDLPLGRASCPPIEEIGLAAVILWLNSYRWIHRRAESMQLEDGCIGSRVFRISFTVPDNLPSFELGKASSCCIPVSLLRKHKVDFFSLTDGNGRSLPLLGRQTRGEVAAAGLGSMASAVIKAALGQDLPSDLATDIGIAARGKPAEAIEAMARMEGAAAVPDPVSAACRALLMGYEAFRLLIWSLALNSLALVRVPYLPGQYEILTARYDEPLNEVSPGSGVRVLARRAFRTTGITPKKLWFPARALPSPSSNHYRIAAPDGLQISASTLSVEHLEPAPPSEVMEVSSVDHPSVQETIGISDSWEERDRETGSLPSTHLYDRELPEYSVALVRLNLRPAPGGALRAIWLTAALAVLLLAMTDTSLDVVHGGKEGLTAAQSASALLLVIPTLLAAYIARPGEHTLTAELLFGTRLLGLLAGGTTFVGAGYLVLTNPSRDLGGNWTVLVVIASAILVILTISFLINWAMAWPEGDPAQDDSKLARFRTNTWVKLRRRLG